MKAGLGELGALTGLGQGNILNRAVRVTCHICKRLGGRELAHRSLEKEHTGLEKQHFKGPEEGTAKRPEWATWNSGETEELGKLGVRSWRQLHRGN